MKCECYRPDKNYLGKIGICAGTKELETCWCDGDESRCDFYDYVRERARQNKGKPLTNYDRIVSKSPEEMADFLSGIYMLEKDAYGCYDPCSVIDGKKFRDCDELIDWLNREVDDEY